MLVESKVQGALVISAHVLPRQELSSGWGLILLANSFSKVLSIWRQKSRPLKKLQIARKKSKKESLENQK